MNNDSVFPVPEIVDRKGQSWGGEPGLTKRELFAAMAMQGMLANSTTKGVSPCDLAEASIIVADSFLAELAK